MPLMQSLRRARVFTRLVLVWFACFVGIAVAAPVVKAESTQWVCSAMGGVKLVQLDASGHEWAGAAAASALDCPACLPLNVPLAAPAWASSLALQGADVLQPPPVVRLASAPGQPWQARAPPLQVF